MAAELKGAARDIPKVLSEFRRRLENSWRQDRSWAFDDWQDRFVNNGLLATLTKRLIWTVNGLAGSYNVMVEDGRFISSSGDYVDIDPIDATVRLWHPLLADENEISAWRLLLISKRLRQPFMQAWRPVYVVTDAERDTKTYSNRFAGHILHQPIIVAMLRQRGWTASSADRLGGPKRKKPNQILLPAFGVSAEYSLGGIGPVQHVDAASHGASNYIFATTDRVVFRSAGVDDGGENHASVVSLDAVPAMAFSETMRDIDLIVGISSIGCDRFWSDRGTDARLSAGKVQGASVYRRNFGKMQPGEMHKMRWALLDQIIPSLEISDRCRLLKTALMVRGDLTNYVIHLGSGNVHLEHNGRYLCIVRGQFTDIDDQFYVPFEGDEVLSLILSKAILLAHDSKIEDKSIRSQIIR